MAPRDNVPANMALHVYSNTIETMSIEGLQSLKNVVFLVMVHRVGTLHIYTCEVTEYHDCLPRLQLAITLTH